jgi:AcrR family transcriptional regulator
MTAPVTDTGPPDPDTLPPGQRERRSRIVRAAIDLLEVGEYDTIQMRDVAAHSDVALGTLYRYFRSKEHLYAAALVDWSADYRPRSRPGVGDGDTDVDRLRALMKRAVRAFERRPQMMRAEVVIEGSSDPHARALFDRFAAQNLAALTDALRDASPEDAAAIIETVNSVLANRLRSWALGRTTIEDVERAVQRAIDLIYSPPPS